MDEQKNNFGQEKLLNKIIIKKDDCEEEYVIVGYAKHMIDVNNEHKQVYVLLSNRNEAKYIVCFSTVNSNFSIFSFNDENNIQYILKEDEYQTPANKDATISDIAWYYSSYYNRHINTIQQLI